MRRLTTEHTNDHIRDICHETNKHWRQYTSANPNGQHAWGRRAKNVRYGQNEVMEWFEPQLESFDLSIYATFQFRLKILQGTQDMRQKAVFLDTLC
jgi:hypothetical protein